MAIFPAHIEFARTLISRLSASGSQATEITATWNSTEGLWPPHCNLPQCPPVDVNQGNVNQKGVRKMSNKLLRFQTAPTLILGMATLLWLPGAARAQYATTPDRQQDAQQDRQAAQNDDITRRDLARFDQFLDTHREDAEQLRRTPSLVDDPQFLQSHPELNTYLQDHPSVKQEISQRPDTFMRLEDRYDRDHSVRDRDAGGSDAYRRDADRDRDAYRTDADARDRDDRGQVRGADPGAAERDAHRRDLAEFDRFLDGHGEIAEQVRKDPSLVDNREFVQTHQPLQDFLRDHPGVREQLKQDPNAFMRQEDRYDRDSYARDRDAGGDRRDADRRQLAEFDHFLDRHREIAEQIRKDPSLADNREFVQNHPPLQDFLRDNPGVRDQLRQDPNAFMRQEDQFDRPRNGGDRDAMHSHMADFGGFLGGHADIQRDLSRNPSVVKDHEYVQNHAELNTYLNARPEVRDELMANPQSFVKGAQQYSNNGTGANGAPNGTSTNPATTHDPKPKQ
jgi:hypothetical protein